MSNPSRKGVNLWHPMVVNVDFLASLYLLCLFVPCFVLEHFTTGNYLRVIFLFTIVVSFLYLVGFIVLVGFLFS